MEYNSKKQQKLSLLKDKMLNFKNKSKSPEKAEVKFNIVNKVDVTRLLNTNKQYTDSNKDDLKKIYKLNRNEKKIKFLSYDFHQISDFKKTYNNNNNIKSKSENSFGLSNKNSNNNNSNKNLTNFNSSNNNSNLNNNSIFISESYKIKNEEKAKTNFSGFDKIISKYSARITSEDTANNFYSNECIDKTINGKSRNSKDFDRTGISYAFDKETERNFDMKFNNVRPFNLSYMRLSKTDKSENKTKNFLEGKFEEMSKNKDDKEKANAEG